MIVPRSHHALEIDNDKVFAFGGKSNYDHLDRCEKYDIESDSWLEIENLPEVKCDINSTKHKNRIYIVNGDDNCMF